MSLSAENIELFDRYFKGDLSSNERESFDNRLASDLNFKALFDEYNETIEYVQTYTIGQEIGKLVDTGYSKRKRFRLITSLAAAVIMLLIIAPLVYTKYLKPSSSKELFLSYYEPYPADVNPRGEGDTNIAMDLYRAGRYSEAISVFKQSAIDKNGAEYLFLGNCYLQTEQTRNAIESLKISTQSRSSLIRQNGEWYLALAYIQLNDKKAAIDQLKFIVSQKQLFMEKAQELLLELN